MPSVSDKQARTMKAAAADKSFAKKMNIPQSVAAEFVTADKPEAETQADGHGYVRRGPPTKARGQYSLPKSPKKRKDD